jgi:uncharacterized protein YaiL (DUF2058 family)
MSSFSDQFLKAGLVTEEQVKKAAEKPKRHKPNINKNTRKISPSNRQKQSAPKKIKKEDSDLAQFYKERASVERVEKQEADKKKKEAAKLKKLTNDKINKLLTDNLLNDETSEIRYNFVVGTTIKYLFVNEQQQQQLADGELAISFLGGKRALIPLEIAKQVTQLNPNKIVIIADSTEA